MTRNEVLVRCVNSAVVLMFLLMILFILPLDFYMGIMALAYWLSPARAVWTLPRPSIYLASQTLWSKQRGR